jgi:putative hemolysin
MSSSPTRTHATALLRPVVRLLTVVLAVAVLAGCTGGTTPEQPAQPGLANPASEYCLEQGGQVDIRAGADGGEQGFCVFPDGSECEEWAFFRGECEPGGAGG